MMREIKCNCGTIILTDSTIKKYDTKTKQNKKIYAIIDGKEFTEEFVPEDKRVNADYYASSLAIVLYFFQMCEIGKRTNTEPTPLTLFE